MKTKIDKGGPENKTEGPKKPSVVKELIKNQDKLGNITREIKVYKFPQALFKEWEKDCKERFNNCRWLKMMHDHNLSKIIPILNSVMERVEVLESQLQNLTAQPNEPKEKEDSVQTFGGLRK